MMSSALRRVRAIPSAGAATWTTRASFASQASGAPVFEVFNRRTKWMQKERAASDVEASRQADYLKDEVAVRLCERLLVSERERHTQTSHPIPPHQQEERVRPPRKEEGRKKQTNKQRKEKTNSKPPPPGATRIRRTSSDTSPAPSTWAQTPAT